jgi:hypothetical protein
MTANTAWVYLQSEPRLWTVGFYDPAGKWHSDSDHDTTRAASERVAYLNGGVGAEMLEALRALVEEDRLAAVVGMTPRERVQLERFIPQIRAAIAKAEAING